MNWILLFLRGTALVRLEGESPQRCLNGFLAAGIAYWDLKMEQSNCWQCRILSAQVEAAQKEAGQALCDLQVVRYFGFRQQFYGLRRRITLLVMMALTVVWILLLPNFIWIMDVTGNQTVPAERILQELSEMDIRVGTWVTDLPHPRLLKYEMQQRIPELQWIAVNCYGGRAVVEVAERQPAQASVSKKTPVNLVAARDGVILELDILNGFPVCTAGQAVREGDLLVSGVMDHVRTTQVTRAYGEVYALTKHEFTAVTPTRIAEKRFTGEEACCVYINIGRKRIKIFGNSGISVSGCDKIVNEKIWTLPGGYPLPFRVTKEVYQCYEAVPAEQTENTAVRILSDGTHRALNAAMIAGQIQSQEQQLARQDGWYSLTASFWCREMIARAEPVYVQTRKEDENGTNH